MRDRTLPLASALARTLFPELPFIIRRKTALAQEKAEQARKLLDPMNFGQNDLPIR